MSCRHLSGLKTLLDDTLPDSAPPGSGLAIGYTMTTTQKAAFWVLVGEDCSIAYVNRRKTRIDPENLTIWHAAGLPLPNENRKSIEAIPPDLASKPLMWLLSKLVNFVCLDDEMSLGESHQGAQTVDDFFQSQSRSEIWLSLRNELRAWFQNRPVIFQPYARLVPRQRPSGVYPYSQMTFKEVYYNVPMCAAAMTHYHFASILLLLNQPSKVEAQ